MHAGAGVGRHLPGIRGLPLPHRGMRQAPGLGHRHRRGRAVRGHGGRGMERRGLRSERSSQRRPGRGEDDRHADLSRAPIHRRTIQPRPRRRRRSEETERGGRDRGAYAQEPRRGRVPPLLRRRELPAVPGEKVHPPLRPQLLRSAHADVGHPRRIRGPGRLPRRPRVPHTQDDGRGHHQRCAVPVPPAGGAGEAHAQRGDVHDRFPPRARRLSPGD